MPQLLASLPAASLSGQQSVHGMQLNLNHSQLPQLCDCVPTGVQHFKDIQYTPSMTYSELFMQIEYEMCCYNLDEANVEVMPLVSHAKPALNTVVVVLFAGNTEAAGQEAAGASI